MPAVKNAATALVALLLSASCIDGGDGVVAGVTAPPPGGGGPIAGTAEPLVAAGLVSAVANANSVHVSWQAQNSNGQAVDVALFVSTSRATLYSGAPELETNQDGEQLFSGLTPSQDYFVGFALRTGPGQFAPSGPVLTLHTSPPIFVRAGANAATADGLTPGTAFPHPFEGVLSAFANGGGNVWIGEGTYSDVALPVFAGVHLFGGFDAGFDPSDRDAEAHASVLVGRSGVPVVDIQGSTRFATLDGLTLDGAQAAPIGISIADTPVSLRNLDLSGCSGRGIRIRNQTNDRLESHALAVRSSNNGGDGLSALGPFEFCIERCVFNSNVQEGVEFDDLIGLDGEDSTLVVRACRFFGNGTQGLDVDLAAPPTPGPLGSRFDIQVLGCAFEHNGEEGLLLDIDYDLVANWSSRIEVGHCTARANRTNGVHLDLDGNANALIHHCLSTANAGNGVLVTSETTPALATVSASAITGNGGHGVFATLGNAPVLLSHCVLSGNALGGVLSNTVESSAVGCIAHEQAAPFSGVRTTSNLVSSLSEVVFENIAESWRTATALNGDRLAVLDPTSIVPGVRVQLAGDGIPRMVLSVDAVSGLRLDSTPEVFQAPARVAVFPPGSNGVDDFGLANGSLASGMGFALPGSSTDAGLFGAPLPSEPGAGSALSNIGLKLASVSPALSGTVAANQLVTVSFTGAMLDIASVNSSSVRALSQAGTELSIGLSAVNRELHISPPPGGWPSGAWSIELHRTLRSDENEAFASPVALPMRTL